MGVGKTSKGRKLSERLGFRFSDMDLVIEGQEGMSVGEIFKLHGEGWFRKKETEVLHQLGDLEEDMVISTGGGAPCFNNNMDYINTNGISVYLRMSPDDLAIRLSRSNKPVRPLLLGKSQKELLEYIHQKLSERETFYLQSKLVIDAKNVKIKELINLLHL